jgi:hypothetical protein
MPDVSQRSSLDATGVSRSLSDWPRDRQDEHFRGSRLLQHASAGRGGCARRKDIIYEQNALATDEARALDRKSVCDAFASCADIHSGAVAFGVKMTHEAPFVAGQIR